MNHLWRWKGSTIPGHSKLFTGGAQLMLGPPPKNPGWHWHAPCPVWWGRSNFLLRLKSVFNTLVDAWESTTLHILVDHRNVVGWQLVLNYM